MSRITALVALALCVSINLVTAQDNQAEIQNVCPFENLRDTIVLALRNRDEFSLFRRVVEASDINDLNINTRRAKLTILAPTNAAFDRLAGTDDLGFENAESILDPDNENLRNRIVRMQITNSGAFPWQALKNNQVLQTLLPDTTITVNVDKTPGQLPQVTFRGPVNNAVLTDTNNIKACKSFIHGIDNVLRPAN